MYEGNKEKKISDYLYRTLQNAMEFVAEKRLHKWEKGIFAAGFQLTERIAELKRYGTSE